MQSGETPITPRSASKGFFSRLINKDDTPKDNVPTSERTRGSVLLESYKVKTAKAILPPGYSDELLELEMELENEEVDFDVVNRLTVLYTEGMAHYQLEAPYKYKFFSKKLQELMMKPIVKEAMVRQISHGKSIDNDKEIRRMRLETKISQVNTEKEAFMIVQNEEVKQKEIVRVVENNVNSQKERLRARLAERKMNLSRARSVTQVSDNSSEDLTQEQASFNEINNNQEANQQGANAQSPIPAKVNNLNQIEEVDESRFTTPPRKRNKDGLIVFYGSRRGSNELFELIRGKNEKHHARRHSFNKEEVLRSLKVNKPARADRPRSYGGPSFGGLLEKGTTATNPIRMELKTQAEIEKDIRKASILEAQVKKIAEVNEEVGSKSEVTSESSKSEEEIKPVPQPVARYKYSLRNNEEEIYLDSDNEEMDEDIRKKKYSVLMFEEVNLAAPQEGSQVVDSLIDEGIEVHHIDQQQINSEPVV